MTGADAKGNTQIIPDKETINQLVYEIRAGHDPNGERMLALIGAIRRFAYQIATPFFRQGSVHPDELDGLVFLSLSQAVQTFDETREMGFLGFFRWFLLRELINAVASAGDVCLPVYAITLIRKYRKARRQLSQQLSRDPLDGEIAHFMGVSLHEVHSLQHIECMNSMLRLDAPVNDGTEDSVTLADAVKAPGSVENDVVDGIYQSLLADAVQEGLDRLPDDIKTAVQAHYMNGEPLQKTAEQMKTSRERVRNLCNKGLRLLRSDTSKLKKFLDDANMVKHTSFSSWYYSGSSIQENFLLRAERLGFLSINPENEVNK